MKNEILDTHDCYPEATIYENEGGDYGNCPSCGERFNTFYEWEEESGFDYVYIIVIIIVALAAVGTGRIFEMIRDLF